MSDFLNNLHKGTVFTPNVDHLINVRKNRDFGRAYSIADYKLCDSQILFFASRFLGSPIVEKISGSDLFPAFYQHHKDNLEMTIFLLGGMGDASVQAQANINRKVEREIVIDAYSPPFGFDTDEEESRRIVARINQSGATVLAIGVGAPKQEQWISQYRQYLTSVNIIFAIGAAIDFEAGLVPRAPQVVSQMGVEWLYRLVMEPKRLWKRYLVNDLPFLWLLLKQKMLS
jgi:exopolysaccharide biosynthesis WecB/TagA/CpsF family protein